MDGNILCADRKVVFDELSPGIGIGILNFRTPGEIGYLFASGRPAKPKAGFPSSSISTIRVLPEVLATM